MNTVLKALVMVSCACSIAQVSAMRRPGAGQPVNRKMEFIRNKYGQGSTTQQGASSKQAQKPMEKPSEKAQVKEDRSGFSE